MNKRYLRIPPIERAAREASARRPRLSDPGESDRLHNRYLTGHRRLAVPARTRRTDQPNLSDLIAGENLWEVAGGVK